MSSAPTASPFSPTQSVSMGTAPWNRGLAAQKPECRIPAVPSSSGYLFMSTLCWISPGFLPSRPALLAHYLGQISKKLRVGGRGLPWAFPGRSLYVVPLYPATLLPMRRGTIWALILLTFLLGHMRACRAHLPAAVHMAHDHHLRSMVREDDGHTCLTSTCKWLEALGHLQLQPYLQKALDAEMLENMRL